MDTTSNNINQTQFNQNNSYNAGINNISSNYQGTGINNNYMNGGKNITPQPNNNLIQPNPPQFIPQNTNQTFWNGNYNMPIQNAQQISTQPNIQNQNENEFILLIWRGGKELINNLNNPLMNMQYIMSEYNNFLQNPVQWLTQHNVPNPQQAIQNPQVTMQGVMNNNVNNQQFNQIMSLAQMIRGISK